MQNNLPHFPRLYADQGLHVQNSIKGRKKGTFRSIYL